jgi:RNA polymerase sigma-70 factor (ECF subfamily)
MFDIDAHAPEIQDQLWREHADRMLRYATFLVGPTDANDVTVDAFLGASRHLTSGSNANAASFLLGAVRHRVRDVQRSRRRRWQRDLAAVGPRTTDLPDTFADVRTAVAQLSIAQRSVVFLAYWEDRTERDIADILSITPSTVHRHLERARTHLGKALQ